MQVIKSTGNVLRLLAGLGIFAALPLMAQQAWDVHALATAADKHYNSLHTLETHFQESYKGGGQARVETGTLWLSKPGRMRWEYSSPRAKIFVCDGRNAWFYVPGERQARHMAVKSMNDLHTPLLYLLGHTKLEKEFEGLQVAQDQRPVAGGSVVLRGVPRAMKNRVSRVLLELAADAVIMRIRIDELDGSSTEFRFTSLKENAAVAAARFHFTPPHGVEVLQTTEMAP